MEEQGNVDGVNDQLDGVDADKVVKADQVSYDSYKRVLDEKKRTQEKLKELEDFKAKIEMDEKERQGKHTEVIEALRAENLKLKSEFDQKTQSFAYSKFEDQIKNYAVKEGCVNPDKLMRLLTKEQMKSVEIADNFQVNKDDLKRLIDGLKDEHSDIGLFKATNPNFIPVTGGTKVQSTSLGEMSKDEILEKLRSL